MRLETTPVGPMPAQPEEDEEEEEVMAAAAEVVEQSQGRKLAQSGQRVLRRSLRQVGQIPLLRLFEGCCGHFHTSSSSL
ncbi:hypothetical protein LOK49_LG11G02152 [Camellia lanceoleosa]|uniref:Uncharacterized protein n=1 Tax=Camellia lanceoleosa TaxID=1840588 RepID=A0ACC0G4L6_9ERIC|nr:hypothetical protein LOK49_LG11G02152 [Camellia lanceoleosa]